MLKVRNSLSIHMMLYFKGYGNTFAPTVKKPPCEQSVYYTIEENIIPKRFYG